MPSRCLIKNCDRQNKHLKNRSLFHFPKDLENKTKWLSIIPRTAYNKITKETRICSLHFEKKFLKGLNSKRYDRYRLDLNAFPSLNFDVNDPKCSFDNVSPSNSKNHEESIGSDEPELIVNLTIKNEMICRACLCDGVESLKSFLDDPTLLDMYAGCTFLQVEMGDGLPMNLCTTCIAKCTDWLSFKQQCEQNDLQLRSQLITIPIAFPQISKTLPNIDIDEKKMMHIDLPLGVQIPPTTLNDNNLDSEIMPLKNDLFYEEIDVKTEFFDIKDSTLNVNSIPEFWSSSPAEVTTVITTNNEQISKKPYKCDKCYRSYETSKKFSDHKRTHINTGPCTCDVCGKDYETKQYLRNHMTKIHGPRRFPCTKCPKRFGTNKCLREHIETHAEEKLFECQICKKRFRTKKNIVSHMVCHLDKPRFLCSFCGRAFKTKFNLKEHFITHTGERRFACTTCNKTFKANVSLKKHLLLHSNTKSQLRKPRRIKPTGEKRFTCNICKQWFFTRKELGLHLRTHADKRISPCTFCEKVFKYNYDLIIHLRQHTGERPFSCDLCTETFTSQKMLKMHNVTKHLLV